jgi:DNA-binding response OmpR family regulator
MQSILFVDDNPQLADIHSTYLSEMGYSVMTASDGQAALDILDQHPFDLLITDVVMPGKEGFETIMAVKATFPLMPIIAISGGGRVGARDYLTLAMSMGAHATLEKPFSTSELFREVRHLLKD